MLRANLAAVRDWVEADRLAVAGRLDEYGTSGSPYPDRLPIIALATRCFVEMNEAMSRWVDWAELATADWDGTTPDDGASVPPDVFMYPW